MFHTYQGEYQQNQMSCEYGPRWEGNQLADYVSKLVTACEDRAQELGFVGLAWGLYDPADEAIFEEAVQATFMGLRASIAQALQTSWGPGQVEALAKGHRDLDWFADDPPFSEAPTAGQYVAWVKFSHAFIRHYTSRKKLARHHVLLEYVDYCFSSIATASVQELDRQLQAEKAKTAQLQAQMADVLTRLNALENQKNI